MPSKKLSCQLHPLLTFLELKNFSCCNVFFSFHKPELPGCTLGPQSLHGDTQSSYKGALSTDSVAPIYGRTCLRGQVKAVPQNPICSWQGLTLKNPKSKQKSSILSLLQMIWDLSCQKTLFWVRMNGHFFCLVSCELCLYDSSLETVGQFCQNKINLKTLEYHRIIALLYLYKCVPGRTKTGVRHWRCRDVKTKHSVTRPTQEIRSTELCSLID